MVRIKPLNTGDIFQTSKGPIEKINKSTLITVSKIKFDSIL